MKPILRDALAESHILAVAVAVLLFLSFVLLCQAIMLAATYVSKGMPPADFLELDYLCLSLFFGVYGFGAAWLLSRWVYGAGPLRSLSRYRALWTRRGRA